MRRKLAFDDVLAKRFGDLYIDGKFPVNARSRKILHGRYYAKRFKTKQALAVAIKCAPTRCQTSFNHGKLEGQTKTASFISFPVL